MSIAARLNVVFASLLLCSGCAPPPEVELFSISGVSPEIVEPGDVIVVEGEGFVEGSATVSLTGQFKPVGMGNGERRTVKLQATAVSPRRIELRVTESRMYRIAKEVLFFNGIAEVSFPTFEKESVVSMESHSAPFQMEFRPEGGAVKAKALKRRAAKEIFMTLGLNVEATGRQNAISVSNVTANSRAAEAGVSPGDVLLTVDGFPVSQMQEMAGLDVRAPHRFEFLSESGLTRYLYLNPRAGQTFSPDQFIAVLLTAAAMAFFLSFPLLRRLNRRLDERQRNREPLANAVGAILVTVLALFGAAYTLRMQIQVAGTVVVAVLFVLALMVLVWLSPQTAFARLFNAAGSIVTLICLVAVGAAAGNSAGVFDAVFSQSSDFAALHVWHNPFMPICFALGAMLLWPTALLARRRSLTVVGWLFQGVGAFVTVVFWLGGWHWPGGANGTGGILSNGQMILGAAVFVAKFWFVVGLSRLLAGASLTERRKDVDLARDTDMRSVWLMVLSAMAVAWELAELPAEVSYWGKLVAVFFFFFLMMLFIAYLSSRIWGQRR